jgi:hypothetical protein
MSDKYFKTTAVSQAFIKESNWKPSSAKALFTKSKAPQEILDRVNSNEFDPTRDLLKVSSVLVSTGMNRNEDVFLPEELAKVRSSGEDKPFDIEHDITKIVGHMTKTFITSKSGDELSDEDIEKKLPDDFDITNEGVIYAYALPDVAEEIKKRAAAGQLFVSVEMWFTDYDYLVGNKIIARNESTSFLDQHLRTNGGDGIYKEQTVGRVLRNMLIGGIGFVEKPANPESVIKSIASLSTESTCDVVYNEEIIKSNIVKDFCIKSNSKEDIKMSKELLEEMAATTKAAVDSAVKKALDEAKASGGDNKEKDKVEASNKNEVVEPSADVKALMETVASLKNLIESQSQTIATIQHEKKVSDRRVVLATAGLTGEDLQRAIECGADMNDANFKSFCDLVTKLWNEKNLRSEASKGNQTETKEDEKSESNADDSKENEDESTEASNEDDTLVDFNNLEDVDPDVGSGEGKSEASLEDKMFNAVAKRLAGRSKRWHKLAENLKEE